MRVGAKTLVELCAMPIAAIAEFFAAGGPLEASLEPIQKRYQEIAILRWCEWLRHHAK